jgi:hypothetical protein
LKTNRNNSVSRNSRVTFAIVSATFLFLVMGCLGGSSKTCTGELVIAGKKYNGIAKSADDAKRNTCSKYCIEGDPEMDAMFRIWRDSLPADKKKTVRDDEMGKWDALYDSDSIKRYVERCETKCLSEQDFPVKCEG